MGQVTGIMHGSRELTGDLDLLWDGEARQADALSATFAACLSAGRCRHVLSSDRTFGLNIHR